MALTHPNTGNFYINCDLNTLKQILSYLSPKGKTEFLLQADFRNNTVVMRHPEWSQIAASIITQGKQYEQVKVLKNITYSNKYYTWMWNDIMEEI